MNRLSLLSACAALLPLAPLTARETPAVLIKGGQVMAMTEGEQTARRADVLVLDGKIAEIGESLTVPENTRIIDASRHLVLPGFVDVHSHLSITQMRGLYQNTKQTEFFPLTNRLAAAYEPEDIHTGMLWAALESVHGGITTTVDFFDNVRSRAHAEAGLRALQDSPIRARLHYGAASKTTNDSIDLEHLRALHAGWEQHSRDGRISLGMAWRLPRDLNDAAAWETKNREYKAARDLGLPISVHVSGNAEAMFDALVQRDLIHPCLQVVHATDARPDHLAALGKAGGSLALTPLTEHRVGYGLTLPDHFSEVPRQGFGIDGHALAGTADMFATLRLAALTQSGADKKEAAISPRRLLEIATRIGAESIGLGKDIGTLEPGKRADIQVIDLAAINLGLATSGDPASLIVYSARPENVSTVLIDGRIVKEDGRLTGYDIPALLEKARASILAIRQRAGDAK